jgi:hypothetical protein
VSAAEGRDEVVELADLRGGQLNAIGGSVLLDAGDVPGAGDRSDVVTLGQQPGQGQLRRGDADLGGDYFDLVGDAQVVLEVLAGEARVVLAPVVVVELFGGADLRAVSSRAVGFVCGAQILLFCHAAQANGFPFAPGGP